MQIIKSIIIFISIFFTNFAACELSIPQDHPALYMKAAAQHFGKKEYKEAIKWYYVGQIRFRVHLLSNPNLDPSGDPALYASINSVVGKIINEYAGSDPDELANQIEAAIKWHNEHENTFTPKSEHQALYQETVSEYEKLIAWIRSNKDEIRKKRAENGLKNR